jgi:hypothetical protein
MFAAIGVWFEITDKFASGPLLPTRMRSVVNWYVAVLKLMGVAAAVLAVVEPPRFLRPSTVGVLLSSTDNPAGDVSGGSACVSRRTPDCLGWRYALTLPRRYC